MQDMGERGNTKPWFNRVHNCTGKRWGGAKQRVCVQRLHRGGKGACPSGQTLAELLQGHLLQILSLRPRPSSRMEHLGKYWP